MKKKLPVEQNRHIKGSPQTFSGHFFRKNDRLEISEAT